MGSVAGTGIMASNARAPNAPSSSGVYRPTYTNYSSPAYRAVRGASMGASNMLSGLGGTPQAMQFQPMMPTYTRPSAPTTPVQPTGGFFGRGPQPAYRIPYNPPSQQQQLINRSLNSPFFLKMRRTPEQQAASLNKAIQNNELTYAQYERMMAKPDLYLPYVQSVQAGNAPTTIGYQQRPVQYMTEAQRQAYNNAQSRQLSELLGPAPADPSASNSDGA